MGQRDQADAEVSRGHHQQQCRGLQTSKTTSTSNMAVSVEAFACRLTSLLLRLVADLIICSTFQQLRREALIPAGSCCTSELDGSRLAFFMTCVTTARCSVVEKNPSRSDALISTVCSGSSSFTDCFTSQVRQDPAHNFRVQPIIIFEVA